MLSLHRRPRCSSPRTTAGCRFNLNGEPLGRLGNLSKVGFVLGVLSFAPLGIASTAAADVKGTWRTSSNQCKNEDLEILSVRNAAAKAREETTNNKEHWEEQDAQDLKEDEHELESQGNCGQRNCQNDQDCLLDSTVGALDTPYKARNAVTSPEKCKAQEPFLSCFRDIQATLFSCIPQWQRV